MSRRNRILTALLAAATLLFAQLAVSAYACPMAAPQHEAAQAGCDQDMGNMNLCERHCDYGSASVDAAKPAHAAPLAVLPSLRIALAEPRALSTGAHSTRATPGPAPPPPLGRFTVLRI